MKAVFGFNLSFKLSDYIELDEVNEGSDNKNHRVQMIKFDLSEQSPSDIMDQLSTVVYEKTVTKFNIFFDNGDFKTIYIEDYISFIIKEQDSEESCILKFSIK